MPQYNKYYELMCDNMPSNRLFCYFGRIWRKWSIPTHYARFNPPTFELTNGIKTA